MKKYTSLLFCILLLACNHMPNNRPFQLQAGDLLFQDLDCGPFCEAIEAVTTGADSTCLSHIGMVVSTKANALRVIEAISSGVVLTPLDSFLLRSEEANGSSRVLVGRVKPQFKQLLKKATERAFLHLGKPYDTVFNINNSAFYCSELIYEAFGKIQENEAFFPLSKMTFKAPGTDQFFPAWENYFKDMGTPIPEGAPGLNPGSISRDPKIDIVYRYGNPAKK